MNTIYIILIVITAWFLLGPIMLGFAKLNHVNPYINEKECRDTPNFTDEEIKSFIIVNGPMRILFQPLWLETKIIRWFKKIRN